MPGRLAVDFGTSNTVIAVWDEKSKTGVPYHLSDFGKFIQQGNETISVIPSLIHYTTDNRRWIGNQVLQHNLYQSERTFRWMKRYISHRSPLKVNLNGQSISHFDAGKDFLTGILMVLAQDLNMKDEEIVLSSPVEAYEHYENWLAEVAESAGLPRFRLIDEPSAAALGYGAHIQPGNVYLIFDFGGGTLHAAVIFVMPEDTARAGRRCRVLGKAGKDIGGTSIDQWLFQEVLRRNNRFDYEEDIRRFSNQLLVECELAKENLSYYENASITVVNPDTGGVLSTDFTRSAFENLLDQHDLFTEIDRTLRSALNSARERGYTDDTIQSVLMVGGSSQIPSVQKTIQRIFGRDKVLFGHPLDAVACGAAAFSAGVDFYDHIQHDYAIRYVNPANGGYDYRILVKRGTPYPTDQPACRLTIKAHHDGQTQLGLAIYEVGPVNPHRSSQPVELVFDPAGAVRLMQVAPEEQERRSYFWMNENNLTFLIADPPANEGETRYEVEFNIDGNKRLMINARDIRTGMTTHHDFPVIKLT